METVDLSIASLVLTFHLLALPVVLSLLFGFRLLKPLFYAVGRMTIQLILIGIFLKYLFLWNNTQCIFLSNGHHWNAERTTKNGVVRSHSATHQKPFHILCRKF